jgi:hypothetical protein
MCSAKLLDTPYIVSSHVIENPNDQMIVKRKREKVAENHISYGEGALWYQVPYSSSTTEKKKEDQ